MFEAISNCLILAKEAVSLDCEGKFDSALLVYERLINDLQSDVVVESLNEAEDEDKLVHLIIQYSERISQLRALIQDPQTLAPITQSNVWRYDDIAVPLWLNRSKTVFEPAPQQEYRKPYWLMRLLHLSIHQGAYISDTVFIAQQVWNQKDVRFTLPDTQKVVLDTVIAWIKKAKDTTINNNNLELASSEFQQLQEKLAALWMVMSKTFKNINTASVIASESAVSSCAIYIETQLALVSKNSTTNNIITALLSRLFSMAQYLDSWLMNIETLPQDRPNVENIRNNLIKISAFLWEAMLSVIINDLRTLMRHYINKNLCEFRRS